MDKMKTKNFLLKRVLLLVCTLFPLIGMSEMRADTVNDIDSKKTFKLHSARGYIYYDGTNLAGTTSSSSASTFALIWHGTLNGGLYYLYDVTNGAFVCHTGDNYENPGSTGNYSTEMKTDLTKLVYGRFSLTSTGNSSYPYMIYDRNMNYLNIDGQNKACFNSWSTADEGNRFAIEYIDAFDSNSQIYQNAVMLLEKNLGYAELSSDNTTLTFRFDNARATYETTFSLNTGTNDPGWYAYRKSITSVEFTYNFDTYAKPTSTYHWFSDMSNLTSISGLNYLNTSEVTTMRSMFYGCSKLTSLNLNGFNTANVTDMSYMFQRCSSLTSLNVSSFNTANVTNMGAMFDSCSSLTSLDVSGFNTANVTYMAQMFYGCQKLTALDVSGFNTANVGSFALMFYNCSKLTTLDVSGFNTAKATTMSSMFCGCSALTSLDVSGFNTALVTNMGYMFNGCSALTSLDVSGFNTALVTNMGYMFCGCYLLKSLDVSSFNTAKVTNMNYMFANCDSLATIFAGDAWSTAAVTSSSYMFTMSRKLVGGAGTTYNESNPKDATYAHIDGGTSNPGYLTSDKISFADAAVKAICVNNWDTDGDGELSIAEARVVTGDQMGTKFENNTSITSFDELRFFTGLGRLRVYAFHNCSALQSIKLPESLTAIETDCFWECSSLQSLHIPKNVTSIGYYITARCAALETITVDPENTVLASPNNCNAIIKDDTLLVAGCKNTVIPDGVTTIGVASMNGLTLTSLEIPASVTEIQMNAFGQNSTLQTVTILATEPPLLQRGAFGPVATLKENCILVVPDGCRQAYLTAAAGDQANTYAQTFKEIRSARFPGHVHIDNVEAATSTGLAELAVFNQDIYSRRPDVTVTAGAPAYFKIDSDNGWWQKKVDGEWQNVQSGLFTPGTWRFQCQVRIDGDDAAAYVLALPLSVKVNDEEWTVGVASIQDTYSYAVVYSPEYEVKIPITEAYFPDRNFRVVMQSEEGFLGIDADNDQYLSADEIADVTELDLSAYRNYLSDLSGIGFFTALQSLKVNECNRLTALDLSQNTALQRLETRWCTGLTALDLSHNTELTYLDCQQCGSIAALDLSANTKLHQVVCHSNNMSSLIMPSTSTTLQYITCYINQLRGSAMNTFINSLPDVSSSSEEHVIYIIDDDATEDNMISTAQVQAANAKGWNVWNALAEEYTGTEVIAFADPAVKAICVANYDTDGDGELTKDEVAAVTTIDEGVFTGNTEIQTFNELQYFTGLTTLDLRAFKGCSNLRYITLPENLETISNSAFYGTELWSITIPEGVTKIWGATFAACDKLTSVSLPSTLTEIGLNAFTYCTSLRYITIPEGVTVYGDKAFDHCDALTQVTVKNPVPADIGTLDPFPTRADITLVVPAHCADAYRTADYWREFKSIQEQEPTWTGVYTDDYGDKYQYEVGYEAQLYQYADQNGRTSATIKSTITVDGITYPVSAIAYQGLRSDYLQSLTIPENVTTIKENALWFMPVPGQGLVLQEIHVQGQVPPTVGNQDAWYSSIVTHNMEMQMQYPDDSSMQVSLKDVTLYVPIGAKSLYEADTFWKQFTIVAEDSYIAIDATNFPDANFRAYVASEGIDADQDGYLSSGEIAAVTEMNVSFKNIASMQGLEYFTELETLDCSYNHLTALDVSANTKLDILYFQRNNIGEDAMSLLVESLPTRTESIMCPFQVEYRDGQNHYTEAEGNRLNSTVWKAASDKGWTVSIDQVTPGLIGDVNNDGNVTIADVTALVNIILGKGDTTGDRYYADVNGDNSITIADVTALVNKILGKN